jgi:hypothetical protein
VAETLIEGAVDVIMLEAEVQSHVAQAAGHLALAVGLGVDAVVFESAGTTISALPHFETGPALTHDAATMLQAAADQAAEAAQQAEAALHTLGVSP